MSKALNFKGVLLDLDNTFYAYEPCHEHALLSVFKLLKQKKLESDYDAFLTKYKKAQKTIKKTTCNQAASHNRVLYFQIYLEAQEIFSPPLILELYETYWDNFLKKMTLFPYFRDFLKKIKANDIKVGIVTDLTAHIQNRKLIALDIFKDIDFLVSSEEAGVEKPTPTIFKLALEKLALDKEEVIFIGDNFTKDIEGANAIGIRPYWFSPENDQKLKMIDFYTIFSNYKDLTDELF